MLRSRILQRQVGFDTLRKSSAPSRKEQNVLLGAQYILLGHGGPATPIEGQTEVLKMRTSAMLGEAHHNMRKCNEVGLLELGGEMA